ncbi:MAG: choice-of-anchor Q domain-containing protein, partial [Candidatus Methylacidiphilales bacterium]
AAAVVIDGGILEIKNSIFADSSLDIRVTGTGSVDDQGYNFIETRSGFLGVGTGTQISLDPLLSAPGWYGGPTQTIGLLPGSQARDVIPTANYAGVTTDQRGVLRGEGTGQPADIGAFESRAAYTVTNTADYNPATVTHVDGSLRLGLAINAAGLDEGQIINFNILPTDAGYNTINGKWTIEAAAGTTGFVIANGVTITGSSTASGPSIILDGNQLGATLFVNAAGRTVTLDMLGITNGAGRKPGASVNTFGGGININAGTVNLNNSFVYDNRAVFQGGGIYTQTGTTLNLSNTVVDRNSAGQDGGGIFNAGTLRVSGSTISHNSVSTGDGGGIFSNGTGLTINTGSVISYNTALGSGSDGGGIATTSTTSIDASTITGNSASRTGGIVKYGGSGMLTITGSRITSNTGTVSRGGVYVSPGSSLLLTNTTIASNGGNGGGGVIGASGSTITLSNSTIAANVSDAGGGLNIGGTATINNSTRIVANTATTSGGGIIAAGSVNITNGVVVGNSVISGNGGGIYVDAIGSVSLTTSEVVGNSATGVGSGGGMYVTGGLSITRSTVRNNFAGQHGGGLQFANSVASGTITRSTFSDNFATRVGGAVYLSAGTLNVDNSTFAGNRADEHGGAWYINPLSAANITSATISSNTSALGTGGVVSFGLLTVTNTIIAGNSGPQGDLYQPTGTYTDGGYNIFGVGIGVTLLPTSTAGIANPMLAPLGNYGGPTWTMALLPGSPAIDPAQYYAAAAGTGDQRNVPRVDGTPDIGAYESRGFVYSITGGDNQSAMLGSTFAQPLVVRIDAVDSLLTDLSGGTLIIVVPGAGPTATGVLKQPIVFAGGVNTVSFVPLTAAVATGTYQVGLDAPTSIAFTLTNTNLLISILANAGQGKTYGQADPSTLSYSILDAGGAPLALALNGLLLRQAGEDVGSYLFDYSQLIALNPTYSITITDPASPVFTISPALLTVTATVAFGTAGESLPTLSGTVTGFQFADTQAVISGLTYSSDATSSSPAGEYVIIPGGASARNYTFRYLPALLTLLAGRLPPVDTTTPLPTLDMTEFNATRGRNNEDEAYYLRKPLPIVNGYTVTYEGKTGAPGMLHLNSGDVVPPMTSGSPSPAP